jgi:hypothetical protein
MNRRQPSAIFMAHLTEGPADGHHHEFSQDHASGYFKDVHDSSMVTSPGSPVPGYLTSSTRTEPSR